MKVLITGGAGFIGSHIAEQAIGRGDEVLIVDDLSTGKVSNCPAKAGFEQIDICDAAALTTKTDAFAPQVICHHAAQASVAVSVREPIRDAQTNILGSINMLELAKKHNARFVFASTGGALYGEVPEGQMAKETTEPQPLSPYACSKVSFEHYLRAYHKAYGIRYTIVRYGNVFGPRQDPHGEAGVVAIFLNRLLTGQGISVNARRVAGDDGCVRDYVYVDDVVRANLAAFDGKLDAMTINIGTGIGTSTRTLAQVLAEQVSGATTTITDGNHREGDLERSVLDASTFHAMLGPPTELSQGLSRTTDWFRTKIEGEG